jgi:hypothetical protein
LPVENLQGRISQAAESVVWLLSSPQECRWRNLASQVLRIENKDQIQDIRLSRQKEEWSKLAKSFRNFQGKHVR